MIVLSCSVSFFKMADDDRAGVMRGLRGEITCALCLEIYTDPKKLPCDHVYCSGCLHNLAIRSINGRISCPECRRDSRVPDNVSNFAVPHRVNRLIAMYHENQLDDDGDHQASASSEPKPATCQIHNAQPLALYCTTCEKLVCRDCALLFCARMNHKHGFVNDLVEELQADLQGELGPVTALHKRISGTLDEISAVERKMQSVKESKLQNVASVFDDMCEVLTQERRYFVESIENSFLEQDTLNSTKKREISLVLEKLEHIVNSVEVASQNESKEAFLAGLASKKASIEAAKKTKDIPLSEVRLPEIEIELCSPGELKDVLQVKNFFYRRGDPVRGHAERNIDLSNVSLYKTSEITLYLNPSGVRTSFLGGKVNLTVQLYCHRFHSSVSGIIKAIAPEKYVISFVPLKRGRHELRIKYDDVHVCGSPFPVFVTIQPEQLKGSSYSVKSMRNTGGIKYHDGCLYIGEANSLKVLDASTRSVMRTIQLPGRVCDTLLDPPYIYITDTERNRVVKMNLSDATIVKTTGHEGTNPGEFRCPNGIRLSKDNEIFVVDTGNNRIQVFDKDLNLIRVFGSKGDGDGFFNVPNDLDFDDEGNLYVLDNYNHRVQVLTPQGRHLRNIGKHGTQKGELQHPCSAAIQRGMVYITDRMNKRIAVHRTTGEFVATFGEGTMSLPECVTIDDEGYVHVTDDSLKLVTF